MHYVYILESDSFTGRYYVGETTTFVDASSSTTRVYRDTRRSMPHGNLFGMPDFRITPRHGASKLI